MHAFHDRSVASRAVSQAIAIALLVTAGWSCGPTAPEPPNASPGTSAAPITVTGSELLAWNQVAPNAAQVAQYRFVAYVDAVRQSLPDAACQGATATTFECSARLPKLSTGTSHRLELAAVITIDGREVEGERSTPIYLIVPGVRSTSAVITGSAQRAIAAQDGVRFDVEMLARGFDAPSALAVTPEGRVFIADRSGFIWVWQDGQIQREPALRLTDAAFDGEVGLIGITLHPDFSTNRLVYVVYTAGSTEGTGANRLLRYRELNGTFGERIVLMEDAVTELPRRTPRLRFGPDRKLYVALAAGADRAMAESFSSYSGKLLRLNDDGTTPRDNPRGSPVVSYGHRSAGAFDWQPATGRLWCTERDWSDRDTLSEIGLSTSSGALLTDGRQQPTYAFESSLDASNATFYSSSAIAGFKDNLFIAALGGEHMRRVQFDARDPTHVIATERLLDHQFGRVSDIVAGPDGALYLSTSNPRDSSVPAGGDRLIRVVGSSSNGK